MKYDKAAKKIEKVMGEYKSGKLHSGGSGKVAGQTARRSGHLLSP